MTAASKTTIKTYFQTGDKPTQAQFIDFIDSYQDTAPELTAFVSAATSSVGVVFVSAGAVSVVSAGSVGLQLLSTTTTAAATEALGLGTPGTVGLRLLAVATTAAALQQLEFTSVGTVGKQLVAAATTAAATNALGGAPALTKYFQSANQTITAAAQLTLSHGLGAEPTLVAALLENVTNELGYVSGDRVVINAASNDAGAANNRGLSIIPTATDLVVRFGSDANSLTVVNKTTGGVSGITNASWQFIVRAWV